MGSALSQALAEALRGTGEASHWLPKFSNAFTDVAGISGSSYVVSPDALSQGLADAVQALQATQTANGKTSESSWVATVGPRLQQAAIPVFDRREQLTPGAATCIRLVALCLAAEADTLHGRQLGDAFREIAAGVTLLEHRANGDDPATETIMLASE
jgi:hypothetical protein